MAELRRVEIAIQYRKLVTSERVVFNIGGNHYRLVAAVSYRRHGVTVVWLGTHKEYDKIDVKEVQYDKSRYSGTRDRDGRRP